MSVPGWIRARAAGLSASLILPFLHFAVEILRDGFEGAIEEALLDVAQDHFVAGAREHVRDAVAHRARAEHADRFDRVQPT